MEVLGNNGEFVTIQFRSFFYKKTTVYMFEISKVNIFLKKIYFIFDVNYEAH